MLFFLSRYFLSLLCAGEHSNMERGHGFSRLMARIRKNVASSLQKQSNAIRKLKFDDDDGSNSAIPLDDPTKTHYVFSEATNPREMIVETDEPGTSATITPNTTLFQSPHHTHGAFRKVSDRLAMPDTTPSTPKTNIEAEHGLNKYGGKYPNTAKKNERKRRNNECSEEHIHSSKLPLVRNPALTIDKKTQTKQKDHESATDIYSRCRKFVKDKKNFTPIILEIDGIKDRLNLEKKSKLKQKYGFSDIPNPSFSPGRHAVRIYEPLPGNDRLKFVNSLIIALKRCFHFTQFIKSHQTSDKPISSSLHRIFEYLDEKYESVEGISLYIHGCFLKTHPEQDTLTAFLFFIFKSIKNENKAEFEVKNMPFMFNVNKYHYCPKCYILTSVYLDQNAYPIIWIDLEQHSTSYLLKKKASYPEIIPNHCDSNTHIIQSETGSNVKFRATFSTFPKMVVFRIINSAVTSLNKLKRRIHYSINIDDKHNYDLKSAILVYPQFYKTAVLSNDRFIFYKNGQYDGETSDESYLETNEHVFLYFYESNDV